MIKNHLNATKDNPYPPDGTFNLKCFSGECMLPCVNSTLWSRQKLFYHACLSNEILF